MRLFLFTISCLTLIGFNLAFASSNCIPYCEEDLIKYKLFSDKKISEVAPSKIYNISGKVLSIDAYRPYGGPPRLEKCYEKYNKEVYTLVTFRNHEVSPLDGGGNSIEILEKPESLKYLTLVIKNSELAYKENPELGSLQERDSFSATAQFSGDECLSEIWISDLKFGGRVFKND